MISFRERSQEKEIFDLEEPNFKEISDAYCLIRHVNQYLGGTRVILNYLKYFSRSWKRQSLIRILDVGTGSADIPQAIAIWAKKNRFRVQVTALDISAEALRFARQETSSNPEISFIQASCFEMPFNQNSFDYIISSMFFHHLSDPEIMSVLSSFDRICKRGIIINDLLRHPAAYYGIHLLSRFTTNRVFRNDAPLSVLRGFKKREWEILLDQTGLKYLKIKRHLGYRIAIAGQKT